MTPSSTASPCWQSPVIIFTILIDTHAQQDVDLDRAFLDVAVYNTRIMGAATSSRWPTGLPHGSELSRRRAYQFPRDLQELTSANVRSAISRVIRRHALARARLCQRKKTCNRAAEVLNAGQKSPSSLGTARSARRMNWSGCRNPGSADHQSAAGQSRRSRR